MRSQKMRALPQEEVRDPRADAHRVGRTNKKVGNLKTLGKLERGELVSMTTVHKYATVVNAAAEELLKDEYKEKKANIDGAKPLAMDLTTHTIFEPILADDIERYYEDTKDENGKPVHGTWVTHRDWVELHHEVQKFSKKATCVLEKAKPELISKHLSNFRHYKFCDPLAFLAVKTHTLHSEDHRNYQEDFILSYEVKVSSTGSPIWMNLGPSVSKAQLEQLNALSQVTDELTKEWKRIDSSNPLSAASMIQTMKYEEELREVLGRLASQNISVFYGLLQSYVYRYTFSSKWVIEEVISLPMLAFFNADISAVKVSYMHYEGSATSLDCNQGPPF